MRIKLLDGNLDSSLRSEFRNWLWAEGHYLKCLATSCVTLIVTQHTFFALAISDFYCIDAGEFIKHNLI